jgi:hypothetical protein
MEALAQVPQVRSVELPDGKLSVHEEFPDAVAEVVRAFLCGSPSPSGDEATVDSPKPEDQHHH